MAANKQTALSVVVPVYNEAEGLEKFHASLVGVLENNKIAPYEIIYCDDGSADNTPELVRRWHEADENTKLIRLSRNFGKESALSAGMHMATGRAIMTLDGDGQHPVELIPKFVAAWENGGQVVVGVATNRRSEGMLKRIGSSLFYRVFNLLTGQKLQSGTTDFRLIDQAVQKEFIKLKETDRITRGLIDWLGFKRVFVEYQEKERANGVPGYSFRNLAKLAANSFVSLTPAPLYVFGFLGVLITVAAFILGAAVLVEQILLSDPWHWHFTGTAMLGIMLLFLVGIVLMSQGILSLYISHMHSQSKGRPLYIVDHANSVGLNNDEV